MAHSFEHHRESLPVSAWICFPQFSKFLQGGVKQLISIIVFKISQANIFSRPASRWRKELTLVLLKHGYHLVPAVLVCKIAQGQFLATTSDSRPLLFVMKIIVNKFGNFRFSAPPYEVCALRKAPLSQLCGHPSDQKSTTGHSFVTTHVGILREIIAAYVHNNLTMAVDIDKLRLGVSFAEVIHFKLSCKRLNDSTPPSVLTVPNFTDPS